MCVSRCRKWCTLPDDETPRLVTSFSPETRVPMWMPLERGKQKIAGRRVKRPHCPFRKNLARYLRDHPTYELYNNQDKCGLDSGVESVEESNGSTERQAESNAGDGSVESNLGSKGSRSSRTSKGSREVSKSSRKSDKNNGSAKGSNESVGNSDTGSCIEGKETEENMVLPEKENYAENLTSGDSTVPRPSVSSASSDSSEPSDSDSSSDVEDYLAGPPQKKKRIGYRRWCVWTEKEVAILKAMLTKRKTYSSIALRLRRSISAVKAYHLRIKGNTIENTMPMEKKKGKRKKREKNSVSLLSPNQFLYNNFPDTL